MQCWRGIVQPGCMFPFEIENLLDYMFILKRHGTDTQITFRLRLSCRTFRNTMLNLLIYDAFNYCSSRSTRHCGTISFGFKRPHIGQLTIQYNLGPNFLLLPKCGLFFPFFRRFSKPHKSDSNGQSGGRPKQYYI